MATRRKVLRYLRDKVIPPYRPSVLGAAIIESMTNCPDEWVMSSYTAAHSPSGVEIWLSNSTEHRRVYKAPGIDDLDGANATLSYGDRVAIDELIERLKVRVPSRDTSGAARIAKLLAPTSTSPEGQKE